MEFKKFVFGETLEQALDALPEDMQLRFYRMIKNYGLHGIEPELTGMELAVWVQMKAMIDITIPKKHNASPVGKVGAPYGNKNAQKTNENNSENNQNNSDELNSKNNSENNKQLLPNGNDNSNGNENSDGDGNSQKKQPPLSMKIKIKTQIKENGFFLDDDPAIERLISETDPSWFDDRYGFIAFISETLRDKYSEKQKSEVDLHNLFRKLLFNSPNLREAYPPWKAKQEKQGQEAARAAELEAARRNHPVKCECCGGSELSHSYDDMYYCTCGAVCSFDTEKIKWVWRK